MTTVSLPRPVSGVGGAVRRHRVELLWGAFATANYAAMVMWPDWETIPFHFVWISLTVLYGFRVWRLRPTLVLLASVMALTAFSIGLDAFRGIQLWGELTEVPLMAAMFLAMVWHARRRVDALKVAEQRADERRAMLERQEHFIADASHVLRTPLTIARGHLELIRTQSASSPELEVALDEMGRIDAIIERLLFLAAANHPAAVRVSEIELEAFLEDVFLRWSGVAPRAWTLGPIASGWLLADPAQLRAALDALIENAVKYTTERDAIELRARCDRVGGVVIEVANEGRGIPPEALERIFDRFARADAVRTQSTAGVGLGLAIADAIAKGHGGHCTATSDGHGASFALRLPRFAPARAPAGPMAVPT
jgi:signal transduction histidine kinase